MSVEAPAKKTLNEATKLLFWIAVESHTLAEMFGVQIEYPHGDEETRRLKFYNIPRPWLVERGGELAFDPDKFAAQWLDNCSEYSRWMVLFILNVWNPHAARSKGWHFDLFKALRGLDQNNSAAIASFCERAVWP